MCEVYDGTVRMGEMHEIGGSDEKLCNKYNTM